MSTPEQLAIVQSKFTTGETVVIVSFYNLTFQLEFQLSIFSYNNAEEKKTCVFLNLSFKGHGGNADTRLVENNTAYCFS